MDEIVHEFLVESHENLDQLDNDLVALEGAPGSRELLGSIFRTIHTIKGTSGFLAFSSLERVTHAGENLLVELRDGRRRMDQPTTDVLLRMVDSVRSILSRIEASGTEAGAEVDDVVDAIRSVLDGTTTTPAVSPTVAQAATAAPSAPPVAPTPAPDDHQTPAALDDVAPTPPPAEEVPVDTPPSPETADTPPTPPAALTTPKKVIRPRRPKVAAAEVPTTEVTSPVPTGAPAPADDAASGAVPAAGAPAPGAPATPVGPPPAAPGGSSTAADAGSADAKPTDAKPTDAKPTDAPTRALPRVKALPRPRVAADRPVDAPAAERDGRDLPATTPPAGSPSASSPAASGPAAAPAPRHADGGVPADRPGRPGGDEQPDPGPAARTVADASIRVDVDLLDALMRQVGELVLARNAITRLADDTRDIEMVRAAQRLSLIASELQEGVLKTRMQPIEHVWSKVPRMVRDLAGACRKQVRLQMTGGDTELDRSLLEAIKDPLTHLIRNAIDHGIEAPEERTPAGKHAVGVLTLRAHHAGGQVVVEVTDDGRGIDPEKVAAKAVERGLRTSRQVASMAQADLLQLLFLPGFSTAESVTNVSGRGVGMDVVRTKIESIGGTVDVESTVGRGTTWRLRIPLTLAIMPALTVACDDQLYAIPQVSLLELVAVDGQTGGSVEHVRSAAVYRLRGDLLPLVDLREVFGAPARAEGGSTTIAVLQADGQRFGLVVDRVLNTEEIVVKPLSARLKAIGLYAGATLLGDGRVSLILDVQAIGRRCMTGETGEADARQEARTVDLGVRDTVQVLLAGIGAGRRVALPLASVTRLEKLPAAMVEHVGGREVVQYRGSITPLVRLDRLLGSVVAERDELTVVVATRGTRSVAVVVEDIIDIVDDDAAHHSDLGDSGLVGSTVLKDRVTELLDVRSAIAAADPQFYDEPEEAQDVPFSAADVAALAVFADAGARAVLTGGAR